MMKNAIIRMMLENDGVNINTMIKQHVGSLLPALLRCDTCGALDHNNTIHIIFNRKFYKMLNRAERRFCILHELGHYSSNDLGFSRDICSEIAADSYVFKHMGYDAAIKAMAGIYKKLPSEEAKSEWKERIERQKQIEWCKQVAHSNYI